VDTGLLATLFLLGLCGGFLSGMVGIGGGIVMFPLLLYVPPALGFAVISVKAAAAITSVQSLFGAVSGAVNHHRHKRVHVPLALSFGGSMAATSFLGSLLSGAISEHWILIVFAAMASTAAILMLLPRPEVEERSDEHHAFAFSRVRAMGLGAGIGVCSGIVGQGGGFLFVPVLMYFLNAPLRVAIGTALAVGVASSAAVVLGRAGTAQIPYLLAGVTVAGAIVGAQLGAELSQRTPRRLLRGILSVVVLATAAKMVYGLLTS
jgi:uncharacterized membrane protein YfcA